MSSNALIGALLLTLLFGGFVFGIGWIWSRRFRHESRLRQLAEESDPSRADGDTGRDKEGRRGRFSVANTALATRVDRALRRGHKSKGTTVRLAQADLRLTLLEYYLLKVLGALLGVTLGLYLGRGGLVQALVLALTAGATGFLAPDFYVKFRTAQRLRAFNVQLSETIGLLANSLRSGYALAQAFELVAREQPNPIGSEFRRVDREIRLGLSPAAALANLYARVPSDDLDLVITAINIQYEVGGNLAEILDTISHTIRERVRMKGEISVLTAQGRISGYMVSAIPLVLGVLINVINPGYMNILWTWPWLILPGCGGLMLLIGFLIIRRITSIDI